MPSRKGCISDTPDGRQSSVWLWPVPGDAALVALLVAGAVEALLAVAPTGEPEPGADEPNPADDALAPGLAARLPAGAARGLLVEVTADFAWVVGLLAGALLVELVAMPSIVAPRPGEPADTAPPDDRPPDELGGETAVTPGVLVKVAPEAAVGAPPAPVLVKVSPAATAADWLASFWVDVGNAGRLTAPLPISPAPPLPGVAPPTG